MLLVRRCRILSKQRKRFFRKLPEKGQQGAVEVNFWVFCEMKQDELGNDYPAYGIAWEGGEQADISDDEAFVYKLANLLYEEQVQPCHIQNVIEDCLAAGCLPV